MKYVLAVVMLATLTGCALFVTAGKGAIVGGAAAAGSFGGPLVAFLAAILAYFGIELTDAEADTTQATERLINNGVPDLGWWAEFSMAVGKFGIYGVVGLLVVLVWLRSRKGEKNYARLDELERRFQVDIDGDGEVGDED